MNEPLQSFPEQKCHTVPLRPSPTTPLSISCLTEITSCCLISLSLNRNVQLSPLQDVTKRDRHLSRKLSESLNDFVKSFQSFPEPKRPHCVPYRWWPTETPWKRSVCGVRLRGVHERARGAASHLQAGQRLTGLEKTWTIFSLGKLLLNKRVRWDRLRVYTSGKHWFRGPEGQTRRDGSCRRQKTEEGVNCGHLFEGFVLLSRC